MALDLLRFLLTEMPALKTRIVGFSILSGMSRGLSLTIINAAAALAAQGDFQRGYLAAFVAAVAVHLGANYFAQSRAQMLVAGMTRRFRMRICRKILYANLRYVESRGIGDIYSRLITDVNQLSNSTLKLLKAFEAAVLLLFCMIYIGWLSLPGLVATVFTAIAGVSVYLLQEKKASNRLRLSRLKEAEFCNVVSDLLSGFKEVKVNRARQTDLDNHLDHVSIEFRDLNISAELIFIRSLVTSQVFTFGMIAVLIFLLPQVFTTQSTVIFQFLAAMFFMIGPLETLIDSVPSMSRARVALANVRLLEDELNRVVSTDESRAPQVEPLRFESLRLEEMHFRVDDGESDDPFDLGPLSLDLSRGEILFLVGGNGSGKTTLLKLLCGLYVPDSGRILVDGEPFEVSENQAYREMYSTVFNDFHLFKRLYGVVMSDDRVLPQLLETLQLDRKTHFEDGAFTSIDLSTGQRKRLAFAVACLENRQIYVFDELAADQDPDFRRFFYRELLPELRRQGKTIVAATHDDRYFDASDRTLKLDYGRIVEQENHRAAISEPKSDAVDGAAHGIGAPGSSC